TREEKDKEMTELNIHTNSSPRRARWLTESSHWALLCCVCLSPSSYAQTSHYRWYQVEMIVFARQAEDYPEHWPNSIKLSYPLNWVELKPATSANRDLENAENAVEAGVFPTPTQSTDTNQQE